MSDKYAAIPHCRHAKRWGRLNALAARFAVPTGGQGDPSRNIGSRRGLPHLHPASRLLRCAARQ